MKNSRALVAAAIACVLVSGLVATQATAATKPQGSKGKVKKVCDLLTDPAGDASLIVIPEPDLDIISADVATNAKMLTVQLRLKSYAATNPFAPLGSNFYVLFNAPGSANPIYLAAEVGAGGGAPVYRFGSLVPGAGVSTYTPAKSTDGLVGSVDPSAAVITMSIPLSTVSQYAAIKPGVKITNLSASTTVVLGVLVDEVDNATGGTTYVAGTPSCVKV